MKDLEHFQESQRDTGGLERTDMRYLKSRWRREILLICSRNVSYDDDQDDDVDDDTDNNNDDNQTPTLGFSAKYTTT